MEYQLEYQRQRVAARVGEKWIDVGTTKPSQGSVFSNKDLSRRLQETTDLSAAELASFKVGTLTPEHHIKVMVEGQWRFYKPERDKVDWQSVPWRSGLVANTDGKLSEHGLIQCSKGDNKGSNEVELVLYSLDSEPRHVLSPADTGSMVEVIEGNLLVDGFERLDASGGSTLTGGSTQTWQFAPLADVQGILVTAPRPDRQQGASNHRATTAPAQPGSSGSGSQIEKTRFVQLIINSAGETVKTVNPLKSYQVETAKGDKGFERLNGYIYRELHTLPRPYIILPPASRSSRRSAQNCSPHSQGSAFEQRCRTPTPPSSDPVK